MLVIQNTGRARVLHTDDGRVIKCFQGRKADLRFENECRILRYLNRRGCLFVPRLLESKPSRLSITLEYRGTVVDGLTAESVQALFRRLLAFGVRHDDPAMRNILYDVRVDDYVLIDFELAEIVDAEVSVSSRFEQSLRNCESFQAAVGS